MKKGKKFIKCPNCNKDIAGSSEKHAKTNLLIHKLVSLKCKDFVAGISCNITCKKCKNKPTLKPVKTGGDYDPIELRCPECGHVGGKIERNG